MYSLFDAKDYGIVLNDKEVETIAAKINTVDPSIRIALKRYIFSNLNYAELEDGKVYIMVGIHKRKKWLKPIKYGLTEFKNYLVRGRDEE